MALVGIDTNILIRVFVRDNDVQTERVARLIADRRPDDLFFVNLTVMLEFFWTLRRFYEYPRHSVIAAIRSLLERHDLEIEHYEVVGDAAALCEERNCDFSDAVIGLMNQRHGCVRTVTFDKTAAAGSYGMELLT